MGSHIRTCAMLGKPTVTRNHATPCSRKAPFEGQVKMEKLAEVQEQMGALEALLNRAGELGPSAREWALLKLVALAATDTPSTLRLTRLRGLQTKVRSHPPTVTAAEDSSRGWRGDRRSRSCTRRRGWSGTASCSCCSPASAPSPPPASSTPSSPASSGRPPWSPSSPSSSTTSARTFPTHPPTYSHHHPNSLPCFLIGSLSRSRLFFSRFVAFIDPTLQAQSSQQPIVFNGNFISA